MPWRTPPQDRSIECNGEILTYYRRQCGWTQQELADLSGYTKRLIAKAEAGGGLSPETLDVLAQTLSTKNLTVFPEDLTTSPRQLATSLLLAITRHEGEAVAHCRHFLAEDLQVFFPGGDDASPLSGVHHGIDAYDRHMKLFFQIFQRPDKELAEKTAVITADGNRAFLACFDKLANEFIPADAPAGPIAMLLVFSRGMLSTIQYLFDTTIFSQVVAAWLKGHPGTVSHASARYMPFSDQGDNGKPSAS
jgi:transcriptional regulator with XRE-family HTH domain